VTAPAIPRRPLRPAYDVVVVGSGSGGAVVARRLAEGSAAQVLLLEAGPSALGDPAVLDPSRWVSLSRGPYDWGRSTAPEPHLDGRVLPYPRGRALGGSSAINAMAWYRGHPADYDAWEALGAEGWNHAACLPYFRRAEDWEGGADERRGAGGPLRIERPRDPHPIAAALIEAAAHVGLPAIADPNGPSNEGAALANLNVSGGRRHGSAEAYLAPVLDRPNLTVLTDAPTLRLVLARGRVEAVVHRVGSETVTTRAGRVVLCAGAVETPRLLMLSGIGDPAELDRLDIPVAVALPGVGRNLQDHPLVRAVNARAKRPLGPARDNGGGAMLNWRSTPAQPRPDVHAVPIQGRSATAELAAAHDLAGDVFAVAPGLMRSRSVGRLRLLGPRPDDPVEIRPNFLDDPRDLEALVDAVEAVTAVLAAPPLADWFGGLLTPAPRSSRRDLAAFVRRAAASFAHACGTCAIGPVVDPRLAVRGVEGLTVADASVIPLIPSCNTHAPVTMIGERAADFLLGLA
jgi:choline dehydrogenase